MGRERMELPQGTLDFLILRTLALEPQHGWAISERIQQVSRDVLQVPQGSLYPALHRLERRGGITPEWGVSDNNRRAKYYALTAKGRRQLAAETQSWGKLIAAVGLVIDMRKGGARCSPISCTGSAQSSAATLSIASSTTSWNSTSSGRSRSTSRAGSRRTRHDAAFGSSLADSIRSRKAAGTRAA